MDEGDIRFYAQVQSVVASVEAIKARIEAMKTENEYRQQMGQAQAYSEQAFTTLSEELELYADKFKRM